MINPLLLQRFERSLSQGDLEAIERSGYGARQGFPVRPALVIVDMTLAYLDPSDTAAWSALENNKKILAAARSRGLPVIFTYPARKGGIAPSIRRSKRAAGALANQGPVDLFSDAMSPLPTEWVLPKEAPSAFFKTTLAEYLNEQQVDGVIVTGVATAACVRATVVDAASHGFKVLVPIEAVADWMEFEHWAALLDMDLRYADVLTTAELLQWLAG